MLLTLTFVTCIFNVSAIENESEYIRANPYFKHFTINDGLPSNEVYSVYQDRKEFIWLTTDRGVSQYDGVKFKNFNIEDGLCSNVIFGCGEDEEGNIWFYSFSGELTKYDPVSELFSCPSFNSELSELINGQIINDISFYKDTIYVSILRNYFKIVQVGGHYKIIKKTFEPACLNVIELPNNQLVYGVSNGKNGYPTKIKYHKKDGIVEIECSITSVSDIKDRIKAIRNDKLHIVYGSNYFEINARGELRQMSLDFKCTPGLEILGDSGILVGSYGKGIRFCGFKEEQETVMPVQRVFIDGLNISCVFQDDQGGIWGSSQEFGLFYFPDQRIKSFQINSDFTADKVTSLVSYSQNLYYGTYDGVIGVIKSDGEQLLRKEALRTYYDIKRMFVIGSFLYYNAGAKYDNFPLDGYRGEAILQDSLKIKILKSNSKNRALESYYPFDESERTIVTENWENGRIHNFCFTPKAVYCSNVNSLYYINHKDGVIRKVSDSNENLDYEINDLQSLSGDSVLVASKDFGLLLVHEQKIIRRISKPDGLTSNCLLSVFYDPKAKVIWVGSDKGLDQIINLGKVSEEIISLTGKFGIPQRPITVIERYHNSLVLGSENDILFIHSSVLNKEIKRKDIRLNRIFINSVKLNSTSDCLRLESEQNNLRFEYANLSFNWTNNLRFRSRLYNEEDSSWNFSSEAVSSYSSVKPGDYLFQVEAYNPAGFWDSENRLEFPVYISPPFWQTWWYRSVLIVLAGIMISLYLKIMIRKAQKQSFRKLALSESQFKALGNQLNPHFVFGIMNSISAGLYKMEPGTAISYIGKLSKLMRQVFKNSQSSLVMIQEEADAVRQYLDLEYIRTSGKFNYSIEISDEEHIKYLYIPSLIIQPFVENALIYGFDKRNSGYWIQIKFFKDKGDLVIEVTDNGKGIDATKSEKRIDKEKHSIQLIKERLVLLEKIFKKGIELNISDRNAQGKTGTSVCIRLPLIFDRNEMNYLKYV